MLLGFSNFISRNQKQFGGILCREKLYALLNELIIRTKKKKREKCRCNRPFGITLYIYVVI